MSAVWIPAKNASVNLGTGNLPMTDAEYQHEIGDVDVTNLLSAGNYEGITDIKKRTIRGSFVQDSNAFQTLTLGTQISATYSTTGGVSHAGTAYIVRLTEKGGPRGAFMTTVEAVFTGPVTNS